MIFIGPTLLSGIGQHTKKYMDLFPGSTYYIYNQDIPQCEHAFLFAIPAENVLSFIPSIKSKCKNIICMTVCETETVHEDYGKLFEHFARVAVPSEFCKRVLTRQFPDTEFYVIHAYIPPTPYVFYHIGNILDPRKNFRKIIEAFIRLNEPDTRLIVKSTCVKDVDINIDRIEVINGLVTEEEMNTIHSRGHCYVNFSNSEGVGMGAIEAAMRDKPVIATSYGGPSEYIQTPYMIDCELQELTDDDFLFKKGMLWGKPKFDQLLEFMRDAYEKRLTFMDHTHTKNIMSRENILKEFGIDVVRGEDEKAH